MRVRVSVDETGPYVYDVGVFFNSQPANGNTFEPAIFMSEWGDFTKTKFCFARGDIELATEPYSPPSDIIIWSEIKRELAHNVTQCNRRTDIQSRDICMERSKMARSI